MDEYGRGETAKHGYGITLYDPKVGTYITCAQVFLYVLIFLSKIKWKLVP